MIGFRWVLVPAVAAVFACGSPVNCGAAPTVLLGQWTYSADQNQPAATLNGTLTIQAGCPNFQGALQGNLVDDVGHVTPFNVMVVGQMLDTTSVVFDAYFGAAGRHHVGKIAHDSITGIWVDQTSGGPSSAGSFIAAKEHTP